MNKMMIPNLEKNLSIKIKITLKSVLEESFLNTPKSIEYLSTKKSKLKNSTAFLAQHSS